MRYSDPVAVVDIGSNSVRLVIYDALKRVPMPVFNEKILCGLGADIQKTGKLSVEGSVRAQNAIKRFKKLADVAGVKPENIFMIATAAMRDAADGVDFVNTISREYGCSVEIISGEDEAKYAGLGIVSSTSKVKGIVGDLGGGSLELIQAEGLNVSDRCSLAIGPLRIYKPGINPEKYSQVVEKHFAEFPLEQHLEGNNFYAVGGAFRNLAKLHMQRANYPLKVIHNYKVSAKDLAVTAKIASKMTKSSLSKIKGVSSKRLDFLPYAAFLIDKIIAIGKPKNIIFAATGIREGILFDKITKKQQSENPLISGAIDIMTRISRDPTYGYELCQWMDPLFTDDSDHERNLRLAACIMSEISCYENTEYRADLAYRKVLDSSLTGLSHKDRVFIAKALYCRYSTYPDDNILSHMQPILSEKRTQKAHMIGSAMRLGRSLSGSYSGVIGNSLLKISRNTLKLNMSDEFADLKGEIIEKRVNQLAEVIGVKASKV